MLRGLPLMVLVGCGSETGWLFQPFSGPGYAGPGELTFEHEGPLLLATTYMPRARGKEASQAFDEASDAITAFLDTEPEGFVGSSLGGRLLGREYRTTTVWTSEEAMLAFVMSDAHIDAMAQMDIIVDPEREIATAATWEIEVDSLPPRWGEVVDELEARTGEKE